MFKNPVSKNYTCITKNTQVRAQGMERPKAPQHV